MASYRKTNFRLLPNIPKMKILQVVQRFYPSIGGTQNVVYNLSKELVKKGHEVTIVTTNSLNNKDIRGFSTARNFTLKSICPKLPYFEKKDGIKIYRFKPIWQFWSYMVNPKMFFFIWKNAKKFDLIHTYCYMFAEPDMVAITNIFKKTPYILSAHDIVATVGGMARFFKKIYDFTFGKIVLKRAKILTALTKANQEEYQKLGNFKNIEILPPGIYCDSFQKKIDAIKDNQKEITQLKNKIGNPKKIILFVGRLIKYKGAHYIIKASPEILKKFPNTKFIFIGEDQGNKEYLLELAKKEKIIDKCIFTGKISDNELYKYYAISNLFILPSAREGFGIVAIEAILSGNYPILANQAGLEYILKEIGGKAIKIDSQAEDKTVRQIEENVSTILSMSIEKGQEDIALMQNKIRQKFDWLIILKQTENLYKNAIR